MDSAELYRWHYGHSLTKTSFILGQLSTELQYWPGSLAIPHSGAEALDEPRECERVAMEVADRYGLGVCFGWVAADEHKPLGHCWNMTTDGEIVDAGNARHKATGYLGKVLASKELARLRQLYGLPADPLAVL